MIYLVTASKDASVYELTPSKNTGLDEILTISKAYTSADQSDIARTFIQFDINSLPSYVTASSTILSLHLTKPSELPLNFNLYAYAVTASWDMGIGTWPEDINTDGINWSDQPGVNYTISASKSFVYQSLDDLEIDIKSIYNYWTGSGNYGLRLSHTGSVETSSLNYGYLKYYSKETNTYQQPYLKIGWDDQSYTTGSLPVVSDTEIIVKTKELKNQYLSGKLNKVRLAAREKYPIKTFSRAFAYASSSALPQSSYYSIVDVITKNIIIGFSDYTKISCDATGSYIKFDTTNYPTNRPLKFNFMVNRDGIYEYYEDDLTFMIK
jgi:hypothetical protein